MNKMLIPTAASSEKFFRRKRVEGDPIIRQSNLHELHDQNYLHGLFLPA